MALTVNKLMRRSVVIVVMLILTAAIFREMLISQTSVVQKTSQTKSPIEERQMIARPQAGAEQIIFIEGSCSHDQRDIIPDEEKVVRLDTAQACALESAARANPETPIYLFHACPMDEKSIGRSSELVRRLFARFPKLFVWHEGVETLVRGTVAEDFYRQAASASTMHDSLRYFMLWKYGGTYLDMNFVFRKPLDALAAEFVAMDSADSADHAALRLRNEEGAGKRFAQRCLTEVWDTFARTGSSEVDPGLFTRVLKQFCAIDPLRATSSSECGGLVVYPSSLFYPVARGEGEALYKTGSGPADALTTAFEDSVGVRVWTQSAREAKAKKGWGLKRDSLHRLALLQREHCPMSYSSRDFA